MGRSWGLWVAVALGLCGYGSMVFVDAANGTLRAEQTPTTIWLYLLAFVGFLLALAWNERTEIPAVWFWGPPVLFRLLLLATDPTLSDDVYRYLWDGHLLTQGVNPYSYIISAAELDSFEIGARALTNNPQLSSPYLPAAHLLFGALALLAPSDPLTMQVVMTGFDLVTAVLLYRLLPLAGLPARRVMLYLWSPLVIVEMAHGAHIDGFMVFLTVFSIWAAMRPSSKGDSGSSPSVGTGTPTRTGAGSGWWRLVSPVAMALAALTRPIPLLLTPVFWWRWTWAQRFVFAGVLVALVVPFGFGVSGWGLTGESFGTGVFGSARVYSQEFRFNALPSAWLERTLGDSPSNLSLAVAVLTAIAGLVVWVAARPAAGAAVADVRRSMRLMGAMLVVYVLITPVLHPWYLVLLLAVLPFVAPAAGETTWRWLDVAPWLYFSAALSLSYLTYEDPAAFGERDWIRRVEWFPLLALLAVSALATFTVARRGRRQIGVVG